MFRDIPGCSGMFRMFHVPGFIDGQNILLTYKKTFLCRVQFLIKRRPHKRRPQIRDAFKARKIY